MNKRVIYLILIIVVGALATYLTFIHTKPCTERACFDSSLLKCQKAFYVNDAADATWKYQIKGKSSGECKVNVQLLSLKQGTADMAILEKATMDCYLPYGVVMNPQENLAKCHGLLKESLQEIIIKKLHNYITENVGSIKEELKKAI